MKKQIKVEIGYYDFTFTSLAVANDFACAAASSRDANTNVRLTVEFLDEEEDEDNE